MRHDRLYLIDMINAADAIAEFVEGYDRDRFVADDMRRSAVQKKLEIFGEASRAISNDLKARHPGLPWHQMIGLRNTSIHQYFSIDWNLIWTTATQHVPRNRGQIAEVLAVEFPDQT
jgi:uncharacterized protein with HEPN domain